LFCRIINKNNTEGDMCFERKGMDGRVIEILLISFHKDAKWTYIKIQ